MIERIHRDFIESTIAILQKDDRLVGIAAGGSYITDSMDEYSDIDFVIAVEPKAYEQVMQDRMDIAQKLGKLLSAFTGEHVGEPRLLICLYGPPLLHVDLKFVSLEATSHRVEDPVILWQRDNLLSEAFRSCDARFPIPELQWIEDRFWVWIHYCAVKIGRGEIFETIESISFLRQVVIGPLLLMRNGKLPRGVRKIEYDAAEDLPLLIKTIPIHDTKSCISSLNTIIQMYLDLRKSFANDNTAFRSEAEKYSREYLAEIADRIKE